MKKTAAFILSLALLLGACSLTPPEETGPEADPPEPPAADANDYTNKYSYVTNVSFSETDLIYFGKQHNDKYILYSDKETGLYGVLCGKPDCTHDGKACNAYTGHTDGLEYYKGRFYWLSYSKGKRYMYSMAEDGTDRKTVKTVGDSNGKGIVDIFCFRDSMFALIQENKVSDGVPRTHLSFYKTSLTGDDGFTLMGDIIPEGGVLSAYRLYLQEGKICFADTFRDPESGANLFRAYTFDTETGEIALAGEAVTSGRVYEFYAESPGVWYYPSAAEGGVPAVYRMENGVSEKAFELADPEERWYISQLGSGVCMARSQETRDFRVWLLDMEGNTLYKGDLPMSHRADLPEPHYLFGAYLLGGDTKSVVFKELEVLNGVRADYYVRYDFTPQGLEEHLLMVRDPDPSYLGPQG